jgi:hypothetical protein
MSFQDREFGDLDDTAKKFSRDLLGVRLSATPTYEFLFFVSHLKSRWAARRRRSSVCSKPGEARTILEGRPFGRGPSFISGDMVLAGDMNDDPAAT